MGFNLALAIAGGTVLVLGLVAGYIKNRLWFSEAAVCLLVGTLLGPALLGIVDVAALDVDPVFLLKEVARLTLGLAVMGAALRLPPGFAKREMRDLAVTFGLGMPLMWISGAVLAWLILGQPWLTALLLGAAMSPTDPVVAGSIATGTLAERWVPEPVRNILSAESGANDGLGMLFVMLPVLLLTEPAGTAWLDWATRVLLWEIVAALLIGAAIGWLAGPILVWALDQPFSESHSTVTIGLALSLTVLAVVRLMDSDGILAVFAAGLVFNRFVSQEETRHEHAQEAIGRFFNLPVFVLFGLMIPAAGWVDLGWSGIVFAAAVLLLRRPPWWLLLGRGISALPRLRDAAFVGWFGPIGVSTMYYVILEEDRTGVTAVWPTASLVVFISVLLHGVSATPFTRRLGSPRQEGETA